jgi:putative ATPase
MHLRNAVTPLMKNQGYGRGYEYAHDVEDKVADMDCLPPSLAGRQYYRPTDEGLEHRLRARMEEIHAIKSRHAPNAGKP